MRVILFQNCRGSLVAQLLLAAALGSASLASGQDVVALGTQNRCPKNYVKAKCPAVCLKAMEAAPQEVQKSDYHGEERDWKWPSGCYFCDDVDGCTDGVWYNEHEKGRANGGAAPLCVPSTWNEGCAGIHKDFLFAGDSDIEYWPNDKRLEVSSDSINRGVGGRTCATLSKKIGAMLEEHTPVWTVLVCGENDLYDSGVNKTFKKFQKIVEEIKSSGSRVLYIGTKPEPETKRIHSKYQKYDRKIRAYAASLAIANGDDAPPLVMVDSYRGFEDLGNPIDLYYKDKLHLSNEGYSLWTDWTAEAVGAAEGGSMCTVWQSGECTQTDAGRVSRKMGIAGKSR